MATHEQYYLTCDKCGEICTEEELYTEDVHVITGETEECVRAEAEDAGWLCGQGGAGDCDFCPTCKQGVNK